MVSINDIIIRNEINSGDLGYIIFLHGKIYRQEYQYGIGFEMYVATGLADFFSQYDPQKDRVWICEHDKKIIGFLLGLHRENNCAQLRYFLIAPAYRGIGLGKKLMELFMQFLHEKKYHSAYLWTTEEQQAAAFLYKRFGFALSDEKVSETFGKTVKEQRYDLAIIK